MKRVYTQLFIRYNEAMSYKAILEKSEYSVRVEPIRNGYYTYYRLYWS